MMCINSSYQKLSFNCLNKYVKAVELTELIPSIKATSEAGSCQGLNLRQPNSGRQQSIQNEIR